jgi:hypothetical protein
VQAPQPHRQVAAGAPALPRWRPSDRGTRSTGTDWVLQLRQNLVDKVADASFSTDLEALVAAVPEEYNVPAAADLAMEKLGSLLDNAPPFDNIRGGKWRGQS